MSKPVIIDVEAKVTPVTGSLCDPRQRALALRQEKGHGGIFEPAVNPEMRGRRPSGAVFRPEYVPPEMKGTPLEEPPLVAVTKRAAKSVAEELTECPATCREQNGRMYIEVVFPAQRLEFHGTTWFNALLALKQFLTRSKQR